MLNVRFTSFHFTDYTSSANIRSTPSAAIIMFFEFLLCTNLLLLSSVGNVQFAAKKLTKMDV